MRYILSFIIFLTTILSAQLTEWKQKADSNNVDALMKLSKYYVLQKSDFDSANYYLKMAADLEHEEAMRLYGYYKLTKINSSTELKVGLNYLERAARLGDAASHYKLYQFYDRKDVLDGKFRNRTKSVMHLDSAVSLHFYEALLDKSSHLHAIGDSMSISRAVVLLNDAKLQKPYRIADVRYLQYSAEITDDLEELNRIGQLLSAIKSNERYNLKSRNAADFAIFDIDQKLKKRFNAQLEQFPASPFLYYLNE